MIRLPSQYIEVERPDWPMVIFWVLLFGLHLGAAVFAGIHLSELGDALHAALGAAFIIGFIVESVVIFITLDYTTVKRYKVKTDEKVIS